MGYKLEKYITNLSALQYFRLLRFGVMILIGIVFTNMRCPFSKSEIGTYETFLLIAAAASSFWINGIIQSLLPIFKKNKTFKEGAENSIFFNVFLLIIAFTGLVILLLFLFHNSIDKGQGIEFFLLLSGYLLFINPSYLVENIYLLQNRPKQIISYGMIAFSLQFILVAGPALLGYELIYCLYGLLIIAFIRFVWVVVLLLKHSVFNISLSFLKEHLHLGAPLIISSLLSGSAQYFDAFLVKESYGKSGLAVFQFGARELPLSMILANAFSNAMLPLFGERGDLNEILHVIKNKSARLMHFLFPVTIVLLAISNIIYDDIYNDDFAYSAKIFNIYLLLVISRLLFPQTILIGIKQTRVIVTASVIEIVVNVVLSLILIQFMGLVGVALATVVAYLLEKLILMISLQRKGILPSSYIPVYLWISYMVLTIVVYVIIDYMIFTDF